MRDDLNGYKGNNTIDMNSPEITRLAYGPEMNAHVARIKEQRKRKSDSFKTDAGLEFADHIRFKAKAPVSLSGSRVTLVKIKPKFCCVCKVRVYTYTIKPDGKIYGECHKDAYQNKIDQEKSRILIKIH